jgi:hypothetical protein
MEYHYTIRTGSPRSGQITITGREVGFYEGQGIDAQNAPLHYVAMERFLSTGATEGVVTGEASAG